MIIDNKVCYLINLGDNCAIIGRKENDKNNSIQLAKVHDVSQNKEELEQIKNLGGRKWNVIKIVSLWEFLKKDDPFYPGLCVSRTLGDLFSHDLISDEPK